MIMIWDNRHEQTLLKQIVQEKNQKFYFFSDGHNCLCKDARTWQRKGLYSNVRFQFIPRNDWITNEDYIFIDTITAELSDTQLGQLKNPAKISALCDRNFGIGGDGLVFISEEETETEGAAYRMEMFNADGSEGKTCGNALRCIGSLREN